MLCSSLVRRASAALALSLTVSMLATDPVGAAPVPKAGPAPTSAPYAPAPLTSDYVERESKVGRDALPAYLLAYPNCITAQPLIVARNPLRDAIIPTTNSGTANCVLGAGNQGYAVRVLQQALNACRGAGLVVDGVYGAKTKTAVKNVQAAFGITADGVYGPVTRSKPIFPVLAPYSGCFGFSYP